MKTLFCNICLRLTTTASGLRWRFCGKNGIAVRSISTSCPASVPPITATPPLRRSGSGIGRRKEEITYKKQQI